MLCPWQFAFKPRAVKNQSSEEKDINNNVEKDTKLHSFVKDDAKLLSLSKKQTEMSPTVTSAEVINCRTRACQGALMTPKGLVRGTRDGPVPPAELLPQAIDFVKQYYSSFKELKIEEHLARLEAVTKEIETTGTYRLTKDELIFAAKQAWRNAPRCIGRIQWSNLQVTYDFTNYGLNNCLL
ncbi:UNVERIFIED_CONTAM: hypothetical protein H355_005973 [Colinus virginianus]|nr:hypothetical protein H355_005973 [Colinus virginianus]